MPRVSTSRTPEGGPRSVTDLARVMLVAPGSLYRDAIERYLREQVWLELVGVLTQVNDAHRLLARFDPDLVLLKDWAALEGFADAAPNAFFVLMEVPEWSKDADQLLLSCVAGFISPYMDQELLDATLTTAVRGQTLLSPGFTSVPPAEAAAAKDGGARSAPPLDLHALTGREMEVLPLMGSTNSEIADELNISLSTVKTHVHHILEKLGVSSRAQAVTLFIRANPDG